MEEPKSLKIIHFNDTYNINEVKAHNCGGVARFVALMKTFAQPKLTLFSGDLWSPSKQSALFQGEQLILPINRSQVDCACLGNHDFDLGLDRLQYLSSRCEFPWLLSNLTKVTGTRLASSLEYHIIEKGGFKVGLMGLVEFDWIATLNCLDVDDLIYQDFVEAGNSLAEILKEDYGCDLIIALTHMRWPNDVKLAEKAKNIDLILGGHDHMFAVKKINDILVLKSGSDFLTLSEINLQPIEASEPFEEQTEALHDNNIQTGKSYVYRVANKWKVELIKRDITKDISPDPEIEQYIQKCDEQLNEKMKVSLFKTDVTLDTKFTVVRTTETPIGNLIADIVRKDLNADCALFNSGQIRADFVYEPALLTIGDLESMLPYEEPIVLIEVTGEDLLEALENSVCKLPALEGRFLQVSHINFEYDLTKPPMERINRDTLIIDNEPLHKNHKYKVATTQYLFTGKDGFVSLKKGLMLSATTNTRKINEIMYEFFFLLSNHEFLEEYRLYSKHKEELTTNFIRRSILKKKARMEQQGQALKTFQEAMDILLGEKQPNPTNPIENMTGISEAVSPGKRDKSFSNMTSNHEDSGLPVLKVLTKFNIDLLFSQKAILSLDCLVRLRKYQLIKHFERTPDKKIVPVIAPTTEKRITLITSN
jgi:5'-nucleotidase